MFRVQHRPMHELKETFVDFLLWPRKRHLFAGLIIQIKGVFRRPAKIIFKRLPVIADFSCTSQDFQENIIIMHAPDIHTRIAHGFVHGDLLGSTFEVFIDTFGFELGKKVITDITARQFNVMH